MYCFMLVFVGMCCVFWLFWLSSPTILFNLTSNIKANTTPEVYQALYNELKHDYPNHQEIFTDGSTSSNKVSAAAVFLNSKLTFFTNLPTMSSIFTAELTAVKIAIQYTQNKPQTPYPIFRL